MYMYTNAVGLATGTCKTSDVLQSTRTVHVRMCTTANQLVHFPTMFFTDKSLGM
jgi:methylaspartate ammonia-lyase